MNWIVKNIQIKISNNNYKDLKMKMIILITYTMSTLIL